MPNEYDAASAKPRPRETPPLGAPPAAPADAGVGVPAWPTMIDETIGSIGNTHGVNESSTPARKNAPTTDQNAPPRSTASIPDDSLVGAAGGATTLAGVETRALSPPAASTRAVPAPPKPVSATAAALCIGG